MYLLDSASSNNHAVYRQQGGDRAYLYYWTATKNWFIGADYSKDVAFVQSAVDQESTCPDEATMWQYQDGNDIWKDDDWVTSWASSAAITISSSSGAPSGNGPFWA